MLERLYTALHLQDLNFWAVLDILILALLGTAGLGTIGATAFRLPRWARERERQMEAIAARAVERMTADQAPALHEPLSSPRLDGDTLADRADASAALRTASTSTHPTSRG